MPKANEKDIYEVRPWLNDDVQNREGLKKIVDGGGSDITVEAVTFTENDTYTAPAGKAWSPVTVNVAGGSSDFSTAEVTIVTEDVAPIRNCLVSDEEDEEGIYVHPDIAAGTYTVPLYKGHCFLSPSPAAPSKYSVTGDASVHPITSVIDVFGDCTITYTP